jgi:hypothetical protein
MMGTTTSSVDVEEVFIERSRRFLRERGLARTVSVRVEKRGKWLVLRGQVDSAGTKSALFGLVPRVGGAAWIVDHLHVGRAL